MFWGNYVDLCNSINRSPNSVAAELGISSGSVTAWKKGRTPKWATLNLIANFFGVSDVDLLKNSNKKTVNLTIDGEKDLLWDKYALLDKEDRTTVNGLIDTLLSKEKYSKKPDQNAG